MYTDVLNPREMELELVVNHLSRVLGTELWSYGRALSALNPWAVSLLPYSAFPWLIYFWSFEIDFLFVTLTVLDLTM